MNTWLVLIDGIYHITNSAKKPNIDGKIITKAGDMVYQFDPGYPESGSVYTKMISRFEITSDGKNFSYVLIDQSNCLETVNKERIYIIGPLVSWLISWLFCDEVITFQSNLS